MPTLQSSFVSNQLQRDRFSWIGDFFYVIAIKQQPDKGEVSDERLFCGDRRRVDGCLDCRGERVGGIMLDEIRGGMDGIGGMGGMERAFGPRASRVCRTASLCSDEAPSVVRLHPATRVNKKGAPQGGA